MVLVMAAVWGALRHINQLSAVAATAQLREGSVDPPGQEKIVPKWKELLR